MIIPPASSNFVAHISGLRGLHLSSFALAEGAYLWFDIFAVLVVAFQAVVVIEQI